MVEVLLETLPLCLSALGGAIMVISIFSLIGRAEILMNFEYRHFAKGFTKTLAKIQSVFGLVLGFLLFFCASAILFDNLEKIFLSTALIGVFTAVYLILYFTLWFKKSKKKKSKK